MVLVERGGDCAFGEPVAGWGIDPWLGPSRSEGLEGVVLTDRGVYRPGESVRVKAILRRRGANRLVTLAPGTPVALTLDRGTDRLATLDGRVGAGGGVEWTVPIAAGAELASNYVLTVHAGTPEPPLSPYDRAPRLTARVAVKEYARWSSRSRPPSRAARRAARPQRRAARSMCGSPRAT